MDVLSNLPTWVYIVILTITFMGAHVLAYNPGTPPRRPAVGTAMRVGSSLILLAGLVLVRPSDPGSILLALLAATVGGFMSGKAAPPPRALSTEPDPREQDGGSDAT